MTEINAEEVSLMFSSTSLTKYSSEALDDGREKRGLRMHDLHRDYCRENAARNGGHEQWYRRLLNGHLMLKMLSGCLNTLRVPGGPTMWRTRGTFERT